METIFRARRASLAMVLMSWRCLALSPCEKFILNTSTREASFLTTSFALLAGPTVQTIFVLLTGHEVGGDSI